MKKQVIAYVHFHWDREWYREFEIFRMRLLRAFDNVLDMLQTNLLPSFYFDGQTSALCDYLEIRPSKKELIKELTKQKRLFIGPFYCLIDEFLTDENVFRKNLEIGMEISKKFGCEDFTGYFADTFGHSQSTIPILNEFGIDKAVVWRGCGDIPAEFCWEYNNIKVNTVNLVRGYFNDVFSTPFDMTKKAEILKNNLDKIAEKSGDILLLPIGADHLGVERNIKEQIQQVNMLLDDYEIKIGTLFDYFNAVKSRFNEFKIENELRDNSKTFILEGSYSSRSDIKKYNIETARKLDLADRFQKYYGGQYNNLIEYAYKLLIQNQAHDSICGCSTDDVHSECITRYKKILQISENIIDEISFQNKSAQNKILNLSDKPYSGVLEFKTSKKLPYQVIKIESGFERDLLADTQRIPVTEDYTDIYTYCTSVKNIPSGMSEFKPCKDETDVFITDKCIGNSKIFLSIKDDRIFIGDKELKFIDYTDNGDSYNCGLSADDTGRAGRLLSSKVLCKGQTRSILWLEADLGDILNIEVSLDKNSAHLDFKIEWENTKKNHFLQLTVDTKSPVERTYSEDMSNITVRDFDSSYDIRKNLPDRGGIEVKSNSAPMHRGVYTNGIGFVTTGINRYEVFLNEIRIPLLRATGMISNPDNTTRTTPAGPPIRVEDLQQIGRNSVKFSIFTGTENDLKPVIDSIFHYCVIV
ncbi:MAG: hypothetical protein LUB59_03075 [Candidatus Gastranaerophilales bacterium]|nr:hypothetical protein [Candidatus Gastranaerophilales bacterium]